MPRRSSACAIVAIMAGCSPAQAQSGLCMPYETLRETLVAQHGEGRFAVGENSRGAQRAGVEFWGNTDTGSFTVIRRHVGSSGAHIGCVVLDGIGLVLTDPTPGGPRL